MWTYCLCSEKHDTRKLHRNILTIIGYVFELKNIDYVFLLRLQFYHLPLLTDKRVWRELRMR